MNSLKTPVIYEIEGTSFEVDIDQQVLRQTNNPANEISFINSMQDKGDHYLLVYDLNTKNCPGDHLDPTAIRSIIIPQMAELDPEGMAAKCGFSLAEIAGKTDFDLMNDSEALALRRKGVLPQIAIDGENFVIDLRLQELRHAEFFAPVISLSGFHVSADEQHYEGYFDRIFKQPIQLDENALHFYQDVLKIRIPNSVRLDPVDFARQYNWDERMVLRHYPVQKSLTAELTTYTHTELAELIHGKQENLRQQHQANAERIRPRHKPKL